MLFKKFLLDKYCLDEIISFLKYMVHLALNLFYLLFINFGNEQFVFLRNKLFTKKKTARNIMSMPFLFLKKINFKA